MKAVFVGMVAALALVAPAATAQASVRPAHTTTVCGTVPPGGIAAPYYCRLATVPGWRHGWGKR